MNAHDITEAAMDDDDAIEPVNSLVILEAPIATDDTTTNPDSALAAKDDPVKPDAVRTIDDNPIAPNIAPETKDADEIEPVSNLATEAAPAKTD